ncbi:UvrD-helicase domain-containing protein [bacterium]|nr:UvrD-helicase domain-containing protein [bacterium]
MTKDKLTLTDEQSKGVDIDTPMGMIAGAGSGKTFVLTERFIALLKRAKQNGFSPEKALRSVIAMTYTRKAAAEMASRIARKCEELAFEESDEFWHEVAIRMAEANIGTIHSFCSKIARRYPFLSKLDLSAEEARFSYVTIDSIAAEFCKHITQKESFDIEIARTLSRLIGWNNTPTLLANAYSNRLKTSDKIKATPSSQQDLLTQWRVGFLKVAAKWILHSRKIAAREIAEVMALAKRVNRTDKLASFLLDIEAPLPDPENPFGFIPFINAFTRANGEKRGMSRKGSMKSWAESDLKHARALCDHISETMSEVYPFIIDNIDELSNLDAESTVAFAKLYEHFEPFVENKLRSLGIHDFDDLLMAAQNVVVHGNYVEDLVAGIASLLVDEFQDTDPVQWHIIAHLGDNIEGSLFWVGDPKQSIYRFRGADVANIEYGKKWIIEKSGFMAQLSCNFRSKRAILNFANSIGEILFKSNEHMEFNFEAKPQSLKLGRQDNTAIDGTVEILLADNEKATEEEMLVSRIKTIVMGSSNGEDPLNISEGETQRPARWGDIALLIPKRTTLSEIKLALLSYDIPHIEIGGNSLFAVQEVASCACLIKYLADSRDIISLVGFLRSPLIALPDTAILAASISGEGNIREGIEICLKNRPPTLGNEDFLLLEQTIEILNEIEKIAETTEPSKVLSYTLERTGAWATFAGMANGQQKIANIQKFIQICVKFDGNGIEQLALHLNNLDQTDESEANIENDNSDAVKIMTIHQSKGLEFPIVMIADLGKHFSNKSQALKCDDDLGILLQAQNAQGDSKSSILQLISKLENVRENAERKRLLYVAFTRARDHLFLSADKWKSGYMKFFIEGLISSEPQTGITMVDFGGTAIKIRKGIDCIAPVIAKRVLLGKEPIYQAFDPTSLESISSAKKNETLDIEGGFYFLQATELAQLGSCPRIKQLMSFENNRKDTEERGKNWGNLIHRFFEILPSPLPGIEKIEHIALLSCNEFDFAPASAKILVKLSQDTNVKRLFSGTPQVDKREERVVLHYNKFLITGVIDRLWYDSGVWHILDYKSDAVIGKKRDQRLEYYAPQLAAYRKAAASSLGIREDSIKTSVLFTHEPVELRSIPEIDIELHFNLAQKYLQTKGKAVQENCLNCPYRSKCRMD